MRACLLLQNAAQPALPPFAPHAGIASALSAVSPAELEATLTALVACGTRHTQSESPDKPEDGSAPSKRGIGAARRYLIDRFRDISQKSGGRLQVREEWVDLVSERRLTGGRARGANVMATLPGTVNPNRIIVISGHYDSINKRYDLQRGGIDAAGDAPGADDDGSGTALVVECARVLSKLTFPYTIQFVCYTAEEQGLLGSADHARRLREAGADVAAVLSNDIVGASIGPDGVRRDSYVRVFSHCERGLDSPARNLARHVATVANLYLKEAFSVKLILRRDRYGRGGDHTSFEPLGAPAVRFTEPRENYHHQHENVRTEGGIEFGDKIEFVDFKYLANVTRVNAAAAAELALAPPPPAAVALDGALRHDTKITITAPACDHRAGFEAVVRETEFQQWGTAFALGASGGAVPVLLDDHVVGVRAVAIDGRRSIAVVPPEPSDRFAASRPARGGDR